MSDDERRFDRDMASSLREASRSQQLYSLAMTVFQANAQRQDFEKAEAERANLHSLLDDYLDHFMAANRRVQIEENEHGGKEKPSA